jgi:hypothetical protein
MFPPLATIYLHTHIILTYSHTYIHTHTHTGTWEGGEGTDEGSGEKEVMRRKEEKGMYMEG